MEHRPCINVDMHAIHINEWRFWAFVGSLCWALQHHFFISLRANVDTASKGKLLIQLETCGREGQN